MKNKSFVTLVAFMLLAALQTVSVDETSGAGIKVSPLPGETHLANIRQLTFGGQNAEAYFSHDAGELIFQSTHEALECDAIFRMRTCGWRIRNY